MRSNPFHRQLILTAVLLWLGLNLTAARSQTPPVITQQPVSQTNLAGENVTFNVQVAGTGPFTYQWQFDGLNFPSSLITTIAGTGLSGYSGDGGTATLAQLNAPTALALDSSGNLFIADTSNNRIRKVDRSNTITTIAGNGSSVYLPNLGIATNVSLNGPAGLAIDTLGNLLIADAGNAQVRKVDLNGNISTVAGRGDGQGYYGQGVPAVTAALDYPSGLAITGDGTLFIADTLNDIVRQVDTNGIITLFAGLLGGGCACDGVPAIGSRLNAPGGVALDFSGNLLIADTGDARIRKVDMSGIVTTVAGNGSAGYEGDYGSATNALLNRPAGIATDAKGNFYIADSANHRIRKVDTNGVITTLAGNGSPGYSGDGGSAVTASLFQPTGVAIDSAGNLFIADSGNNCVRKIWAETTPALRLSGVAWANAGNYRVIISNLYGSVTSTVASLTVHLPPVLSSQPESRSVTVGGATQFSVGAGGDSPLTFQWLKDGSILKDGGSVSGSQTASLGLTNVFGADAGSYSVVVTNFYGSVTSRVAVLKVTDPVIQIQPVSQNVVVGTDTALNVTAVGTSPLFYQWQWNGTNLPGATNSALPLPAVTTNQAGAYVVIASNRFGSVTSSVVTLQVGQPLVIASQPVSVASLAGTTAVLAVQATGTGPFTYQWRFNGTNLTNGIITTVAGNGTSGFSGDGGPATNAALHSPSDVAVDPAGNIFFVDAGNHAIRKVDIHGKISTIAGRGGQDPRTTVGPATSASLASPRGVAVDALGDIFVSDLPNGGYGNLVYKIDPQGILRLWAGGGSVTNGDGGGATSVSLGLKLGFPSFQPIGDILADAAGNLFIADPSQGRVRKVDTNGIISTVAGGGSQRPGDGGPATNAVISYGGIGTTWFLALDNVGNLFVDDGSRIRRVQTNGIITTLQSSMYGSQFAWYSTGIAVDATSNILLAGALFDIDDRLYASRGVYSLEPSGNITVLSVATNAGASRFNSLAGIALDKAGNLLVADTGGNCIRKITLNNRPVLTLDHLAASAAGDYQLIITSPYGSVTSAVAAVTVLLPPTLVSSPTNQALLVGSTGTLNVVASGTPPLVYTWYRDDAELVQSGLDPALVLSQVDFGDAGNYRVVVGNAYGSVTSRVARVTVGLPPGITHGPTNQTAYFGGTATFGVDVSGTGPFSFQWQLDGTNLPSSWIETVAGGGPPDVSGDGGAATNATLFGPKAVAVDASGNFYIADANSKRIRKVDMNGIITTVAGGGIQQPGDGGAATNVSLVSPQGVAVDAAGNLFIAESSGQRIRKLDTNGIITTVAGSGAAGYYGDGGAATSASLHYPLGLALDAGGNLYIADQANSCVRRVDTDGIIKTVAGNGTAGFAGDGGEATHASLRSPAAVTMDAAGNLFIADFSNNRVRKVDTNGIITTVAGKGGFLFDGDGGAATNAALSYPSGVAVDFAGNLYIADAGNARIRRVDTNGIITTLAGDGLPGFSGDGGIAAEAALNYPGALALDRSGDLLVVDAGNDRIRRVHIGGLPTETVRGIAAKDEGDYRVVVTSPFGSVTSAPATLLVTQPPLAASLRHGWPQLRLVGVPGASYVLETTPELSPQSAWQPAYTNTADANGLCVFTDTRGTAGQTRYYRLAMP